MLALAVQLGRFLGIGFLNTAVDFAVLNLFAAAFNVYVGIGIGFVNSVSFIVAIVHSYLWNKSWVFGQTDGSLFKNFLKAAAAGVLGAGVLALVIWGSRQQFAESYYIGMLALLLAGEVFLWVIFRLRFPAVWSSQKEIVLFVGISLVGVLINSGIVAGVTAYVPPQFGLNQEFWTNLAKAAATGVSLIWNFAGYKLFVFKR